jgi:hypothetical protein
MINYFFVCISLLSPLVPISVSIYKVKTFNLQLKVLFLLVCLSFLIDITSLVFFLMGYNSIFLFNIYTILKLGLASIVLIDSSISKRKFSFLFNVSVLIIILIVSILSIFFHDGLHKPNVLVNILSGLYIIFLCIQWFYFLMKDMAVKSLNNHYQFWITSGFLISSSFSLFVNISEDYIRSNQDNSAYLLWIINMLANILFNFFIANGFYKASKN